MYQDGRVTTESRPRRRRGKLAVFAVLLLLIGVALLAFSFTVWQKRNTNPASAAPSRSPTTTLSPVAIPPPSLGTGQPTERPATRYVVVPSYVNVPVASAPSGPSDSLALISTVSGLLASIAGIVSAVVSIRGTRTTR
jgi:hypothetical protein